MLGSSGGQLRGDPIAIAHAGRKLLDILVKINTLSWHIMAVLAFHLTETCRFLLVDNDGVYKCGGFEAGFSSMPAEELPPLPEAARELPMCYVHWPGDFSVFQIWVIRLNYRAKIGSAKLTSWIVFFGYFWSKHCSTRWALARRVFKSLLLRSPAPRENSLWMESSKAALPGNIT